MATRRAFISDIRFLTTLVSFCGILSLALAGLIPPLMFVIIAAIHIAAYLWLFEREILPSYFFGIFAAAVFIGEGIRIYFMGGETVLSALRDMVLILAVGRLVLKKTAREIYQILGISLAECILATVLTTSPTFLAGLFLNAFLIPVALNLLDGLEFAKKEPLKLPGFRHWVFIFLCILGVSVIMFYIIPRPSSTLLNVSLVKKHRTGFSEEVDLSREGTLEQDSGIVMRIVQTKGQREKTIYLSGARLEKLDRLGFKKSRSAEKVNVGEYAFTTDSFTIYPTEIDSKNVFFPFTFASIFPRAVTWQGPNLYWVKEAPPVYDVRVTRKPDTEGNRSVAIPEALEGIASLGREIAPGGTAGEKAAAITKYLQDTCTYSLEGLRTYRNRSPVEVFLEKKKGACEHFASAMAVMLRGAGIPSRVVTGFLVTEFNTAGSYYMVRSSDAHAWVEYWNGAWIMADPTPQGGDQISRSSSNWLDAIRFRWIRWVIDYSLKDQIDFAKYLRFNAPGIPKAALTPKWLSLIIPAFILAALVFMFLLHKKMTHYEKALSALRRKGLKIDESAEYEIHSNEVKQQWPDASAAFDAYQKRYLEWRFGGSNIDIQALTREFIGQVSNLKK